MPQRKNKGLGRGLDALFTEFDETATADETVVELNLDDIRSNPYQPRKTFDETSLSELSDSIRKQGVFQPIIVRQSKVSGYEIIAGERRYRASKMAKRTTIPRNRARSERRRNDGNRRVGKPSKGRSDTA